MSTIDILLLTYNNLDSTIRCVSNLYKFTSNFGLFVLDNGSTDETVDYLKELLNKNNNIYINFQKKNHGIIKGRNKCFDFSRENSDSENIIFIDNDQFVQEGWMDSYLEMMKDFDIVGIEAWNMRKHDFYPMRKTMRIETSFSYVGAGGLMVSAKLFEKLGKFDEGYEFIYFEDPDFCFKANRDGYKVGWNCNPVIEHHHKGVLLSGKNKIYFMKNWKKFREKWGGKEVPVFKME